MSESSRRLAPRCRTQYNRSVIVRSVTYRPPKAEHQDAAQARPQNRYERHERNSEGPLHVRVDPSHHLRQQPAVNAPFVSQSVRSPPLRRENVRQSFRSAARDRTSTAMQTTTKAKSVPMFVSSASRSRGSSAAPSPTHTPFRIVVFHGVPNLSWMSCDDGRGTETRGRDATRRHDDRGWAEGTALARSTGPHAQGAGWERASIKIVTTAHHEETLREEAVAGHGEEDAGQAEEEREQDGGDTREGPD